MLWWLIRYKNYSNKFICVTLETKSLCEDWCAYARVACSFLIFLKQNPAVLPLTVNILPTNKPVRLLKSC